MCLCSGGEASTSETSGLNCILTPSDEFQFWSVAAMSAAKLKVRERAQAFHGLFQAVVHDFANLDSLSFSEVLELIEVRATHTELFCYFLQSL